MYYIYSGLQPKAVAAHLRAYVEKQAGVVLQGSSSCPAESVLVPDRQAQNSKKLLFIASAGDNFYWTGATREAWEAAACLTQLS